MPNDLLPAIAAFARVAHYASFTRAAAELAVSPSALSQSVRMLERRLGVRLLDRTTRRVGVTEIGRRFLDEAGRGLEAIGRAVASVDESRDDATGLLRLNVPRVVSDILVMPHLAEFSRRYPHVVVDLHCDNTYLDLVDGGFDAGFRLGESLALDVVALPIGGPHRLATFAAPSYLATHGTPVAPADLLRHRCMAVRLANERSVARWEYEKNGHIVEVDVNAALISNDGDVLLQAARAGVGIACHFEWLVRDDLASGALVPVLEDDWPTFGAFHIYYPSRIHVPRKLRVFIDFLREKHGGAGHPVA